MIAFLQPLVPHYRETFFKGIMEKYPIDIFCFELKEEISNANFNLSNVETKGIKSIKLGSILIYNPFKLIRKEYKELVLMLHFGHISTWLLLLTKPIHRKKITLWGQGISVKRYLKEENIPSFFLKLMIGLSDTVWLYTEKERNQWIKIFPNKNIVSLNNTISDIDRILEFNSSKTKKELKKIYNIDQEICFIYCARFDNPYRRIDLLENTIKRIDKEKFGFIIIGAGKYKPDFSKYNNVYDFGAVYDSNIKDQLFTIADIYFQPGWVGLSVVEALAYGKPIITFKRSEEVLQCVEYGYLKHKFNSYICEDIDDCVNWISKTNNTEITKMSDYAKIYVKENLLMDNMILNAINTLK
ncbi:MAG: glycosyltransferase [Paludibacter sp.]|nr:glycosyltransferase [Paludibacter sp.]